MSKKKNNLPTQTNPKAELKSGLFLDIAKIIDESKRKIYSAANSGVITMFWQIGKRINDEILKNERAEYGKQIVETVSRQLQAEYGSTFEPRNLRRMLQFAVQFNDEAIVSSAMTQLSWTHIIEVLPLKNMDEKIFYIEQAKNATLSVRELKNLIARKGYERRAIANAGLSSESKIPYNSFRDPYLLDTLDLKDSYLEADLEKAILSRIEKFILEFGRGEFCFVESQKRIIIDGEDFYIDLLFYHRSLKRLVVIELKTGKFMPQHEGQMRLYLNYLKQCEQKEGENEPIGLILCTSAKRERIELLELDKAGIAVSEFWTKVQPKEIFEKKIAEIYAEEEERLERQKGLPNGGQKQIQYFYEP